MYVNSFIPNGIPIRCASFIFGLNTLGTRSVGLRGSSSNGAASYYAEAASNGIDGTYTGAIFKGVAFGDVDKIYYVTQDTQAIYRLVVVDYTLGNVNAD